MINKEPLILVLFFVIYVYIPVWIALRTSQLLKRVKFFFLSKT